MAVVFPGEWGRRGRLDVLIDDVQVGQLRRRTTLLLPLQPGLRRLSVFLASPGPVATEQVDSIPGTQAGFIVWSKASAPSPSLSSGSIPASASGPDFILASKGHGLPSGGPPMTIRPASARLPSALMSAGIMLNRTGRSGPLSWPVSGSDQVLITMNENSFSGERSVKPSATA